MTGYHIGIDLGTSAVKAVAIGADGIVHGRARRPYLTRRLTPGAAEQRPADWWSATQDALAELGRQASSRSWMSIGLCAMLPTLVRLDGDGDVCGPAITWEDTRAEPAAEALRAAVGAQRIYDITGQVIDGRYLGPMYQRLAPTDRSTRVVAGAKDWLFRELTGELLTDPSTAAGFGVYDLRSRRWDPDLVAATGLPALPPVAAASTARPLKAALCTQWGCRPGIPVVLGMADSVAGALGLGADSPGDVVVMGGTSTVVLGITDTLQLDPGRRYLVTPLADDGYGREMDLLATGSTISWMAALLGFADAAEFIDAATGVDSVQAPVFLPFLAPGEQGALWDPDLSGVVAGLHLGTQREHLARAVVTGIVLETVRCIDVLGESGLEVGTPIRVSGTSASSSLFRRDVANAAGRPVLATADEVDHSAIGAAALAAHSHTGERVAHAGQTEVFSPDPSTAPMWTTLIERYDNAVKAAQEFKL